MITTFPNKLQWVAVSNTTNPVTHTADVAVKSESTKLVGCPLLLEIGKDSILAPTKVRSKKPTVIIWTELHFLRNLIFFFLILNSRTSSSYLLKVNHNCMINYYMTNIIF